MKTKWDSIIQSLMLVRLGQELGNHGHLATVIHNLIDILLRLVK